MADSKFAQVQLLGTTPEEAPSLEMPEEVSSCIETDLRRAICIFSKQFGNPRISSEGPLVYEQEAGVAQLKQERTVLYPMLRSDSLELPREVRLRLLAHEIEHARHRSLVGEIITEQLDTAEAPSDEWMERFKKMKCHPDYRNLLDRIEARCLELIRDNPPKLLNLVDHYLEGSEVLARLRAYQVHLQMPSQGTEPHELIEVFCPQDLQWLDEVHLDICCADIPVPIAVKSVIRIGVKG
jgi:hypothetical protein